MEYNNWESTPYNTKKECEHWADSGEMKAYEIIASHATNLQLPASHIRGLPLFRVPHIQTSRALPPLYNISFDSIQYPSLFFPH